MCVCVCVCVCVCIIPRLRYFLKSCSLGHWWCMPLIPALGRQRQANLCEFETSLVYTVSSRTTSKAIQGNPVLKNLKRKYNSVVLPKTTFHQQENLFQLNSVAHTCNSSIQWLKQEDFQTEAKLDYI